MRSSIGRRMKRLNQLTLRLRAHDPKVSFSRTRTALVASQVRMVPAMRRRLDTDRNQLDQLRHVFCISIRRGLEHERARLALAGRRFDALSPLSVLDRGYAIALNEAGEAVKDAETAEAGRQIIVAPGSWNTAGVVDDSA